MATLYDTLGVPAHATDEEIKRAYRKAAMKWHPDRNHGAEETARAAFQEIKDAYAILSDADQRKVYDTVYAEQMSAFEAELSGRRREQAERDAAARAADEAAYAEMVSIAIRFADEGHNRDVLFGVLLGRQCEPQRAAQIADSVAALQAARREEAERAQQKRHARNAARSAKAHQAAAQRPESEPAEAVGEAGAASAANGTDKATSARHGHPDTPHAGRAQPPKREETASDMHPASALSHLWLQFLNGLKF
ncbi:J domain-containing protein [Paraburkholderia sp. MMS20-SJTR3]|uniref:J domain-containing protein n=1 Tax=Paraburkholderia sejongensis TaxID=2886946 RepID=A0ABS8K5J6_9BURK|nr:J domain-containing protein [Paraburkholderia sp. MMS20-SJTR3]MCC8397209.1 J domain-containing protein [Paraburkholderia sp. MMS20-SJTR3]